MELYSRAFRSVIFPSLEAVRKRNVLGNLKYLEKVQWFDREKLAQMQNERLRALLKHAYASVPYYRRLFRERGITPEDIKGLSDLKKLPILTKDLVRENYEALMVTDRGSFNVRTNATSGSTGKPLKFIQDQRTLDFANAELYLMWELAGLQLGERIASLVAAWVDVKAQEKLRARVASFILKQKMLNAFDISAENIPNYIRTLENYKPKVIRAYASTLYLLACFLEKEPHPNLTPSALISYGETLHRHRREYITRQFGRDIFDTYGSREMNIAAECEKHCGYHIISEGVAVEIIKNMEQVGEGELGEVIVTDLNNYAMPFIRYRIEDTARPIGDTCSCGRGFPMLRNIEGRITELMTTSDGKIVPSEIFLMIIDRLIMAGKISNQSIHQYQVVQESKYKLILRIDCGPKYQSQDTDLIVNEIKRYFGEDIEVEVILTESIPVGNSGKHRFVVSKVPVKLLE